MSRAERRAIIGDEDLDVDTLDRFVNALAKARPDPVRQCHQTLRALVLLGASDLAAHDVGEAYLHSSDEHGSDDRDQWRLRASPASAQECVRDVSRLIALAGPSVLAVDQIDTLLARSLAHTDEADDAVTASTLGPASAISRETSRTHSCADAGDAHRHHWSRSSLPVLRRWNAETPSRRRGPPDRNAEQHERAQHITACRTGWGRP